MSQGFGGWTCIFSPWLSGMRSFTGGEWEQENEREVERVLGVIVSEQDKRKMIMIIVET